MLRTCLRSTCVFVCLIAALAPQGMAEEECHALEFTDCPDQLSGYRCESLSYQLVAIDPSPEKTTPAIRYRLVAGPGEIDSTSGLWTCDLSDSRVRSGRPVWVDILATKGQAPEKHEAHCQFSIFVYDTRPEFANLCGLHETVMPGEEVFEVVQITDESPCYTPDFIEATIDPTPSGLFEVDLEGRWFRFVPSSADSGTTFKIALTAKSGPNKSKCRLYYDVFSSDPVQVRIGSPAVDDAKPGDTVEVGVFVESSPLDFSTMRLNVAFDDHLLQFVEAVPGDAFFYDDLCGWKTFEADLSDECAPDWPRTAAIRAAATENRDELPEGCHLPELPARFATLRFVVTDNLTAGEYDLPVRFFWCDCSSNLLTVGPTTPMLMPLAAYDADGTLIEPAGLPGYSGAIDYCLEDPKLDGRERTRRVEYYGGSVHLSAPDLSSPYQVRIGYHQDVIFGSMIDFPVTLEHLNDLEGLGGFDFLIGYDANALGFQQATPGDFFETCGWEYFTYRYVSGEGCDGVCPTGLLTIVGMAETNNGDVHPGCNSPNPGYIQSDQLPVTLFNMRFLITNDATYQGLQVPVRFFWKDCNDNVLVNSTGARTFLSNNVYDHGVEEPINRNEELPTQFGAPDQCVVNVPGEHSTARLVDFYNGGFESDPGWVDASGDVNLNGIAFEIADAVMFSNYFILGLEAFGNHIDGSIAATDVNKDGLTLTLEDLVYLIRVIVGDAEPDLSQGPAALMSISVDPLSGVVSFLSDEPIGAVSIVVEGDIQPLLLADQMEMKYAYADGETRILVYFLDAGHYMNSGEFLQLPSGTELVEVHAATYDADPADVYIVMPPEPSYSVTVGFENDLEAGETVDLPITLEEINRMAGLGGFDLLLAYDEANLTLLEVIEGELCADCEWEYFAYDFDPHPDCGSACPSGLVRITGIAETQPLQSPVTLATLRMQTGQQSECQFLPVRFYWPSCDDNILTDYGGQQDLLSREVNDYEAGSITGDGSQSFPTFQGAPDVCLTDGGEGGTPHRSVDFNNGGVGVTCFDPDGLPGDINRNGIAFEIADAVMFVNYFTQGLSAFGEHVDYSIAASDTNEDGLVLTVEDLEYLTRVLIGNPPPDVSPLPKVPVSIAIEPLSGLISFDSEKPLGVVSLEVEGEEFNPTLLADQMDMTFAYEAGVTRILICSFDDGHYMTSGPFLQLPPGAEILELNAATYDADQTEITIVEPEEPSYRLQIAFEREVPVGGTVDVPITLAELGPLPEVGGFDLLIAYGTEMLTIQDVVEGGTCVGCEWESFSYSTNPYPECGGACPDGLVRITGFDNDLGDLHPTEESPVTLATLRFQTGSSSECQSLPVRFFWHDCANNMLTDRDGLEVLVSSDVFDLGGNGITGDGSQSLPTYQGASDACLIGGEGGNVRRGVRFQNGGVGVLCDYPTALPGDINLNRIAFEIADAVMFTNYFTQGLSAFGEHVDGSVAASDANEDGLTLTIEDLIYILRVIVGDAVPAAGGQSQVDVPFAFNDATGLVSFQSEEHLGGVQVVVEGNVQPELIAGQMEMKYSYDDERQVTNILVYSFDELTFLTSGDFLQIPPGARLRGVSAATFEARPVRVFMLGPIRDPYGIDIANLVEILPGETVELPVSLVATDSEIGLGGFDLTLQYDTENLTFLGSEIGNVLETCGWEYFTYRAGGQSDCGGSACPEGVLRFLALAESDANPPHPGCDSPDAGYVQDEQIPATLFTMSFQVADVPAILCHYEPIRFIWYDCYDNLITGMMTSVTSASQGVFDYDGTPLTSNEQFPTYGGVSVDCSTNWSRHIDFYNGGINIACNNPIDVRGDLDLNGTPFEMADAQLYRDYFLFGLTAFGQYPQERIYASDANSDGIPLSVQDMTYLLRVYYGEQVPPPNGWTECPTAAIRANSEEVRIYSEDRFGAAYLVVEGYPDLTLHADEMEIEYARSDGETRILIYSFETGRSFGDGPLVTFRGEWHLKSIELSSYSGLPCFHGEVTVIEDDGNGVVPVDFTLDQNYPNPFNPSTTITYSLPETSPVKIEIFNVAGQRVRTLVDRSEGTGNYTVEWDGRDDSGNRVSSGVYLYRMEAGQTVMSRKMTLLK